jgi:hypothetical protein
MHAAPAQQPLVQVAALHVLHMPPAQLSPTGQAVHCEPPEPHAEGMLPARQAPPWQQPFGHEPTSQLHAPATQWLPAVQAGPAPHAHAPFVQPSAVAGSQAAQAAPAGPQLAADGAVHTRPEQQPFGQETASHTQAPPPEQRSPAPHGPPAMPQTQAPATHRLVVAARQFVHGPPPPGPQALLAVPGWQAPDGSQQPPAQLAALHAGRSCWASTTAKSRAKATSGVGRPAKSCATAKSSGGRIELSPVQPPREQMYSKAK